MPHKHNHLRTRLNHLPTLSHLKCFEVIWLGSTYLPTPNTTAALLHPNSTRIALKRTKMTMNALGHAPTTRMITTDAPGCACTTRMTTAIHNITANVIKKFSSKAMLKHALRPSKRTIWPCGTNILTHTALWLAFHWSASNKSQKVLICTHPMLL